MWNNKRITLIFLGPAVAALLAVGLYPLLFALFNSFRQYLVTKPRLGTPFVGFDNYVAVLSDPLFWASLGRTLQFLLIVLPVELALGLLIAMLLYRPRLDGLRSVVRVSLVIPMATTYAVVGLIGRLVFNGDFGVANWLVGLVGVGPVEWLAQPNSAFLSIMVMDVWQWTPFVALVLLAGLSMIPPSVEEAARLETARAVQVFRHVQLPYLLPGLTAILILRTADILKLFDMVFVMTRGGPGSATELISIYIQRIGFRVFDQGQASAQAILLLILTIILSRTYIRFVYREI